VDHRFGAEAGTPMNLDLVGDPCSFCHVAAGVSLRADPGRRVGATACSGARRSSGPLDGTNCDAVTFVLHALAARTGARRARLDTVCPKIMARLPDPPSRPAELVARERIRIPYSRRIVCRLSRREIRTTPGQHAVCSGADNGKLLRARHGSSNSRNHTIYYRRISADACFPSL